jgi:phosphoglycerate dehydrogenase-like enzyme
MNVLIAFPMKKYLIDELQKDFPEVHFTFSSIKDVRALKEAEILVTYGEDVTVENLYCATSLKWIMVASAGLEKMPLKEIGERGIFLTNVRGIHKTPMAESVMAILALASIAAIYITKKEWNRNPNLRNCVVRSQSYWVLVRLVGRLGDIYKPLVYIRLVVIVQVVNHII